MEIKPYNRAVDGNTVQGQIQAPANAEAYGANTGGSQILEKGLNDARAQLQAYMDDLINLKVVDASNQYQQKINDLLNNPEKGLLTKKDVNALDVMRQYEEGEAKIRQEIMATLPDYRKAHLAFTSMADDTNLAKLGVAMKYQYERQEEYRENVFNTRIAQNMDNVVENGTNANIFDAYNKNEAVIRTLYGNQIGEENLKQKIKDANTNLLKSYIPSIIADGSPDGFDMAGRILSESSPYVNDGELSQMTSTVANKRKAGEITKNLETARKLFPGDLEKQQEYIMSHNEVVEYKYVSGSAGGTGAFEANATIESGGSGDYEAYNEGSGAFGKYQFLPSTWAEVCAATGVDVNDHSKEAQDKNAQYYWKQILDAVGGDEEAACVAWNWGIDNGKRWAQGYTTGIYDGQEFAFNQPYLGNMAVTERVAKFRALKGQSSGTDGLVDAGFKYSVDNGLVGIEMANGRNGCAEFVGKFGASYSQFLADEANKGVVYVPSMVQDAKDAGIAVIPFDAQNLHKGDCIVYHTDEGDEGHIVVYDGNGGFYGNSSESGVNGLTVHGSDYNIPGMTPQEIIQTGDNGKGHYIQVKRRKYSLDELAVQKQELRRMWEQDERVKQEKINAKITAAKNTFMDWKINNPAATDTESRAMLSSIIGDDEDLRHSALGGQLISLDRSIKDKVEQENAANYRANTFHINDLMKNISTGKIKDEEELTKAIEYTQLKFTPEQMNKLYTYLSDFKNGKSFNISNYVNADMVGVMNHVFAEQKGALDVIVGEKFAQYKAENGGEDPDLETIRQWTISAMYRFDTGATAEYGIFEDTPLQFSDTDVQRMGYTGWERIKTPEGVYIRFYTPYGDFKDVYATEVPDMLRRAGLR